MDDVERKSELIGTVIDRACEIGLDRIRQECGKLGCHAIAFSMLIDIMPCFDDESDTHVFHNPVGLTCDADCYYKSHPEELTSVIAQLGRDVCAEFDIDGLSGGE